jgi:hypothetical protein
MLMFRLPLPILRNTSYTRLGVGPEATADEIRAASDEYVSRLKARGANHDKLAEANELKNLARAEERERYDADHPPLGLLHLEATRSGLFEDRTQGLAVLRRELEAFLARRGSPVYFPSDLTRTDFSEDFTYSSILDGRQST